MERSEILASMGELKLFGMKAVFNQIVITAVKRQHEPQQVIGDFAGAEIAEKQARPIKYQLTASKLPLAKDVDDFRFEGTPINEPSGARPRDGQFPGPSRNVGAGRRHWDRQDAPYHRHCPCADTERGTRPVLHRGIW